MSFLNVHKNAKSQIPFIKRKSNWTVYYVCPSPPRSKCKDAMRDMPERQEMGGSGKAGAGRRESLRQVDGEAGVSWREEKYPGCGKSKETVPDQRRP